ncbi:MAG: M48 family metallopeptidase [Gammaproteobacteria bacterium]|nr:M48 family metallopeptidase [Gammaproteobacteria bacterium]
MMTPRVLHALTLALGIAWTVSAAATLPTELPELGDASSAVVSLEMEQRIGQQLLRQVRAQVPTVRDPLLKYYTELNLYRLAEHSELKQIQLFPVLIDAQEINAFAAPGGVVGVNLGLYLAAEDVHEYSAVISHELAHLSQRHFARQIEMQQRNTLPYLAAMLASIAIAATTGGDAGIAAMSTTQAVMQANQLRFSRGREQEADRIGINTLHASDMDPSAMGRMFERMQRAYRFSRRPPEFLLTHPVSESRISDARNQVRGYPMRTYTDSDDFKLMRARAMVHFAPTPTHAVQQFKDLVTRTDGAEWAYYGLAVALVRDGQAENGIDTLKPLLGKQPNSILYVCTQAEMLNAAERYEDTIDLVSHQLVINPDNKPLSMVYADALTGAKRAKDAEVVLTRLSVKYPDDLDVWYELAETAGLAGNVLGVHLARAEYFARVGNFQKGIQHLEYARGLTRADDFRTNAMLEARIADFRKEIAEMRQS